jgi:hypothetical protein
MNTDRAEWTWDLKLALAAALLFTFESWAFGPYSWMYGYGGGLETLPVHLALQQDGRLFSPLASFMAGGIDRLSFWGNADPFNWEPVFVALFPPWLANGLHRFTQYLIAIYFATRVARDQLGLGPRHARLTGVFYACFSYFTFGEMLALPALPMFLWLLHLPAMKERGLWLPLLTGLLFSTVTTFTQSVPYIACFAALWSAVVMRDTSLRTALNWLLLVIGLSIGDGPQLLAALANADASHRVGFAPETIDLSLDGLFYYQLRFDYFNQDQLAKKVAWYMPLPLLTLGAVFAAWVRASAASSVSLASTYLRVYAVYFLLSQRWLFVSMQNLLGDWLKPIKGIYMGRFFDLPAALLIAGLLAMLVVLVRESMGSSVWPRRALYAVVGALVAFTMVEPKLFLFYRSGVDGWGELNYQVRALEELKKSETEPFRVASVLPLQPGYAYGQGLETVDGWANLYPRVYREYWLRVIEPLLSAVPGAKAIFDPNHGKPQDHYIFLGADLVNPQVGLLPGEDLQRAFKEGFDVERRFNLPLLGQLNVKYVLSEFPLQGESIVAVHIPRKPPATPYSRDWATGLLSPPSGPRGNSITEKVQNAIADMRQAVLLKQGGKDVYVYRLNSFTPRFRFVDEIRVEPDGKSVLDGLSSMGIAALRSTAVVETADAGAVMQRQGLGRGEIKIVERSSDRIVLDVVASGDAFVVMASTWSPYWTAELDGRPLAPVRTNHAQVGVPVGSGQHKLVFAYRPPYVFHLGR